MNLNLTAPTENASEKEIRAYLRKVAAFANPLRIYDERVNTTDATPTQIWTVELAADSTIFVHATLSAVASGVTAAAGYVRFATFRRPGIAAAVQVGTTSVAITQEDVAGWNVTMNVSATTGFVDVRVVGAAATEITWRAYVEAFEVLA